MPHQIKQVKNTLKLTQILLYTEIKNKNAITIATIKATKTSRKITTSFSIFLFVFVA